MGAGQKSWVQSWTLTLNPGPETRFRAQELKVGAS